MTKLLKALDNSFTLPHLLLTTALCLTLWTFALYATGARFTYRSDKDPIPLLAALHPIL